MATARSLTFADLLRRHRSNAGLSQEELAERAGLSRSGISELERGLKRAPHKDTVARLADALALSPHERAAFEAAARGRALEGLASVRETSPEHAAFAGRPAPLAFVGREHELARLEAFLAHDGPRLLLLAGEPGIGKSRLLRETALQAQSLGWAVLKGGCQRRDGQPPFAPLLEALARHLAGRTPAQLRADLAGAAWLARLLPELAEAAVVPAPHWALPPEQERRLMFAAVARYLANSAGPAGTLLVLDDLQWAGTDALDLLGSLAALARPESDPPLRILGAYRSTETLAGHPLLQLLADLARNGLGDETPLGPLTPNEARALLDGLLADVGTHTGLSKRLLERAGGVPFYLVSCARATVAELERAAESGVEGLADDVLPWDAAQSIRQRLALLPDAAADLVRAAAVAGRRIEHTMLEALAPSLGLEHRAAALALEAALHARLLLEDGEFRYRFAHDLIQEAALADLGAWRRRAAHRVIAAALEAHLTGQERDLRAGELAHHFARGGDPVRALPYLERAGDQAFAVHAHTAAEGFYHDAANEAERQGQEGTVARVGEKLATVLWIDGQYDRALEVCDRTAEAYRTLGDDEGMWRALELYAEVCGAKGMPSRGLARLEPLLGALESSAPSSGLAGIYRVLGHIYRNVGQLHESLEAGQRAAEIAQLTGSEAIYLKALRQQGVTLIRMNRQAEGDPMVDRTIPLAEAIGDLFTLSWGLSDKGARLLRHGEFASARPLLERGVETAERFGDPNAIATISALRGYLTFCWGDWARARADYERAALLSPMGSSKFSALSLLFLAELCMAEGRQDDAVGHIKAVVDLDDYDADPNHRW